MQADAAPDRRRRARMVRDQLGDCHDQRVVAAMAAVPRHAFVPAAARLAAYQDAAFAIGAGQTISQPRLVAAMLALLDLQPGQAVLDIGAGSGYVSALLAHLVGPDGVVYAVERQAALVTAARAPLTAHARGDDCAPIVLVHADGTQGWEAHAPFDRIHAGCAGAAIPDEWLAQLAAPGCLVAPVGEDEADQRLCRVTRLAAGEDQVESLSPVRFVPLRDGVAD